MGDTCDLLIIGGGPAGLTAGIYASRARMKALLAEKDLCGGQILVTDTIENFPGFPEGIKGPDLANWMLKQAEHFGLKVLNSEAKNIIVERKPQNGFTVTLKNGETLKCLSLIVASGARWNKLKIPGEDTLVGRGVSYCATCDGPLFKGKDVAVVGGGDTALEDALFLTRFARSVAIIHRRDRLRATKILQERAFKNGKIKFHLNSTVSEIIGDSLVSGVKVKNALSGEEETINCNGVFIFIGITPNSDIVKALVKTDEKGYIITDDEMRTSQEGIFACGDVRKKALRQVITAAGEGASAAYSAEHYVDRLKGVEYK